jgi:hypothetical protein
MRINTRRRRSRLAELVATPPGCVSRPLCWQRRPAYEHRVARRLVVRSVDAAAAGVRFPSWSRWARDPRCGDDLHGCCCRVFSASKISVICPAPRSYPPVDSPRTAIPGFGEGPEFLAHRIRTRRRRRARVEDVELAGGSPSTFGPAIPASRQPPPTTPCHHDSSTTHFRAVSLTSVA